MCVSYMKNDILLKIAYLYRQGLTFNLLACSYYCLAEQFLVLKNRIYGKNCLML